jgi:hypothetical protein
MPDRRLRLRVTISVRRPIMALRLTFEHVPALNSPDDSARDQQTVRSRMNLGSTSERFN